MSGPVTDELLETALKRKDVLATLAESPHHRQELQEALDLSKTTCHRIVRTFDDEGLLRRTDSGYALTPFGELVTEQVQTFESTVRTAADLQPLVDAIAAADLAFDIQLFTDATVTKPEPGNPYPFVDRTMELFRNSETFRVVDCNTLVPPLYVEQLLEIALDTGMQGEFVVTPEIALGNMEEFPDLQREVAESETTSGRYFVHDEITFGMAIYDDHLDLRVYDDETGTPILYVDTDNQDALSWARDVFDRYVEQARPATDLEDYPDWAPDAGIDS